MILRRHLLLGSLAGILASGCKREQRCKHCGMRIDPGSPWRTELVGEDGTAQSFDTPRCALTSLRSGASNAKALRAQEYYDRRWRPAEELRFVLGGDVVGPMGSDLVPVDPARAMKFVQDHGADRSLRFDEITLELLNAIK